MNMGIRQELFGTAHLEVADSLRNPSIILSDKGKWAESEVGLLADMAVTRGIGDPGD